MFAALPIGFPKLEAFARMADGSIPPPPDMTSIGEKVYRACRGRSLEEMPTLRASIRRRVPYAMWLDGQRDINSDEAVVGWYYGHIQSIHVDGMSRTKRLLTPLFHTYVAHFEPETPSFRRLASNLQSLAKRCEANGLQTLRLGALDSRFDFFDPDRVGRKVATEFLDAVPALGIDRWFVSKGLWSGFKSTKLGIHIYRSALLLPQKTFKQEAAIRTLISWTKAYGEAMSAELKALTAEALLKPWLQGDPEEDIKRLIGDFCVDVLGDPRFEGFGWTKVDSAAKSLLLRWLTGRTLDAFFDVLRHTADSIWKYRQDFWTAYYRSGHITEAWAVLGPNARRYIHKKNRGAAADLAYGKLGGQYDESQSVLLMRIGDFVFCEWSHNGKLRAASVHSSTCPAMYQSSYAAVELRFQSEIFVSPTTGTEHQDGLPHLHSETNSWQGTARAFIQKYIGVRP